jgi:ribosome maturation factor RimP
MYTDILQLENELDEFLYHFGYQVVDLQSGTSGRSRLFRLFIDRVDGEPVTIDDCSALAPQVILYLEQRKVYNDNSALELSSAGLDRVLKRNRDLERYLGSLVKVTHTSGQHKATVEGELASFNDEVLVITHLVAQGQTETLNLERRNIERVRLVPQVDI